MRNLKKVLSLALALVMLLGMMVVGAGAVDTDFKDDGEIAEQNKVAASLMNTIGVLTGLPDNSMNPDGQLTRAQACVLLLKATVGLDAQKIISASYKGETKFPDVGPGHWASGEINYCVEQGIITGRTDGTFDPNGNISGIDFGFLLLKTLGEDVPYNTARIRMALTQGKLDTDVVFGAYPITRENAAQMAFNAIIRVPESAKTGKYVIVPKATCANEIKALANEPFESRAEAMLMAQNVGAGQSNITYGTNWTVEPEEDQTKTLAYGLFGLESNPDGKDANGRAATVWSLDGKEILAVPKSTAAATFTTVTSAKDVAAELSGYQVAAETANKNVKINAAITAGDTVADIVIEDGAEADDLTIEATKSAADAIAKLTEDGKTTVEVYANSKKVINKIVVTTRYIGVVSKVTAAKGDNKRTVTLTADTALDEATFESETLEKGDVVLFTILPNEDNEDKTEVVTIEVLEPAYTDSIRRKTDTTWTLVLDGGDTVKWANMDDPNFPGLVVGNTEMKKLDGSVEYEFYTDAAGRVVAAVALSEADPEQAIITGLVWTKTGATGFEADSGYPAAKLFFPGEGVTKTAKLTAINGVKVNKMEEVDKDNEGAIDLSKADAKVVKISVAEAKNAALTGVIVDYKWDEEKDTYTITYPMNENKDAVESWSVTSAKKDGADEVTVLDKGVTVMTVKDAKDDDVEISLTNKTVFVVTTTGSNGKPVENVYTGFRKVPTITVQGNKNNAATAKISYIMDDDDEAVLVYVNAVTEAGDGAVGEKAALKTVYVLNEEPTEQYKSGKLEAYVYLAVLNGEVVELFSEEDLELEATGVYAVELDEDNWVEEIEAIDGATDQGNWAVTEATEVTAKNSVSITVDDTAYTWTEDTVVYLINGEDMEVGDMDDVVAKSTAEGDEHDGNDVWIEVVDNGDNAKPADKVTIKTIYVQPHAE